MEGVRHPSSEEKCIITTKYSNIFAKIAVHAIKITSPKKALPKLKRFSVIKNS